MANIKAAIKDIRKTKTRESHNNRLRIRIKKAVKKFNLLVTSDIEKAKELLPRVNKILDKAADKKVIKKQNASRKISRLSKKLNTAKNVKDIS